MYSPLGRPESPLSNFHFLRLRTCRYRSIRSSSMGSPGGASGEEPACKCRRRKRCGSDSRVGKIPWRRALEATPVFLPAESHGWRSPVVHSPSGRKESDMTERLSMRAWLLYEEEFTLLSLAGCHLRLAS